jgi:nucleotide-binding universal stress UspA family protein
VYRAICTVLVPVDGSPFGEHALPLAVRVARAAGAALRVVHVFSAGSAAGDAPRLLADDGWVRGQRWRRGEYLAGLARRLATTGPRPLTTALLDGADVAGAVCEAAAGADLVVMAHRGRGPWGRFWYGSVAADVARRTQAPVLLVRGGEDPPDFTGGRLSRHVLVPLDGTERGEAALGPAVALGSLSDATHELLHVVRAWRFAGDLARGYGGFTPLPGQTPEAEARRYLRRVANRLARQATTVWGSVRLDDRTTAEAIARHAELTGADLIALTAGGRGALSRLFRGSVADQVLRRSAVLVLLCRPGK